MGKGNRFDAAMGVLERYGGKLQSMTYLVAIKDAFTDLMPIIIIGSFATLINNVVCSTSNGLAQFAGFEFLSQFSGIFSAINYATMNFLAIYLVYRLGHRMAEIRETGSAVLSGFVALACYMSLVSPHGVGFLRRGGGREHQQRGCLRLHQLPGNVHGSDRGHRLRGTVLRLDPQQKDGDQNAGERPLWGVQILRGSVPRHADGPDLRRHRLPC